MRPDLIEDATAEGDVTNDEYDKEYFKVPLTLQGRPDHLSVLLFLWYKLSVLLFFWYKLYVLLFFWYKLSVLFFWYKLSVLLFFWYIPRGT